LTAAAGGRPRQASLLACSALAERHVRGFEVPSLEATLQATLDKPFAIKFLAKYLGRAPVDGTMGQLSAGFQAPTNGWAR
jgi:hypothetical protein